MPDAREIIARALIDLEPITRKAAERYADHIQSKFTTAGFRILGPDELEDVRRLVQIANRNEWSAEGDRLARAIGRFVDMGARE